MPHRQIAASGFAALALLAAACGGGDSSDTAQKAAATAKAKVKAKASGAVTKATGGQLSVAMRDFDFAPQRVAAAAGKVKVTAKNEGQQPHEFVLLKTDQAPDAIPVKNGSAS